MRTARQGALETGDYEEQGRHELTLRRIAQEELIADPTWFPDSFAMDEALVMRFVRASRAALSENAFLDHRMTRQATEWAEAAFSYTELSAIVGEVAPPNARFILHTSFCGSTLMARLLDKEGSNLSLKEPNIINALSHHWRTEAQPAGDAAALRFDAVAQFVLALLRRRFDPGESVLIKPSNLANNLRRWFEAASDRMLVMYSSERSFLRSMVKRGEEGRIFLRTLFANAMADGGGLSRLPQGELLKLTDLQAGLLAWREQFATLKDFVSASDKKNRASLSFEAFLADKELALKQTLAALWPKMTDSERDNVVNTADFDRDSKTGAAAQASGVLDSEAERIVSGVIEWREAVGVGPACDDKMPRSVMADCAVGARV